MFEIVKATPEDSLLISGIKITTWKKAYQKILPVEYLDSLNIEERAQKYHSELFYSHTVFSFLIKFNGSYIGVIKLEMNESSATLRDIYILPDYWGMGFGTKAFLFIISIAKENHYGELNAWILEKNIRCIKLAKMIGFVSTVEFSLHHRTGIKMKKYTYTIDQTC